jgi:hypothetical protein
MTRSSMTHGGEEAVAAGSASVVAAARVGAQEAVHASTIVAAAHVTGTTAEWDSVGKYVINMDNKKPRAAGLLIKYCGLV